MNTNNIEKYSYVQLSHSTEYYVNPYHKNEKHPKIYKQKNTI